MTTSPPAYGVSHHHFSQLADIQQTIKNRPMVVQALGKMNTQQFLWLQTPPCAPDPWTLNTPDHWRHRALQEYWLEAMDWALQFNGPRGGP
jgi:hypothetical protein